MGIPTITGLGPDPSFEDVILKINSLVNELRNALLTLDTVNVLELNAEVITAESITADKIGAKEITADKMNVNQLSAISANLGHITAGLIEAVTIIGSLIQTSPEGTYPRIELASSNRVFRVQGSPNEDLRMYVAGTQPILLFGNLSGQTVIEKLGNVFKIYNGGDVDISAGGRVTLKGVDVISALNSKANAFSGITGSISYLDVGNNPRTMILSNGVITGVI